MGDSDSGDGTVEVGSERLATLLADRSTRSVPVRFEKLEAAARSALDDGTADYVAGGAGGETTVSANRAAFDRWAIRPRMLRGVANVDLGVELLGRNYDAPLMLSPIGAQSIVHEDGEVATARAVSDLAIPMAVSSVASKSLESVAAAAGETPLWFQLYASSDPAITESFLDRAADAGYEAVVVTVDTPAYGWRERDLDNAFHPQSAGAVPENYFSDPAFRAGLDAPPDEDPEGAMAHFRDVFANPDMTWGDLAAIRDATDLLVLVKGILRADDARRAVEAGVDGIVVSNHGGRQVDRAIASLEALPEVVEAVGDDVPVILDSGVRRGSDAFVALALGAEAVCLGRPYLYGLAVAGANGVREVVANVLTDLHSTLAQSGHASPGEIDRESVSRRPR